MILARLYDLSFSPAALIAHVTMTTQRRATYAAVRHKLDDRWVSRVAGGNAVEMRVIASGILETPDWLGTLYERQDAGTIASYQILCDVGDSHTGAFVVEDLSETADAEARRRFRLVLLSAGKVTYDQP